MLERGGVSRRGVYSPWGVVARVLCIFQPPPFAREVRACPSTAQFFLSSTFFTDEETNIISLSRDTKIVKLYWNYSIDPKRRKGVSDETRCCSYSSASRAFPSREGDAFPGRRRVGRGALLIRARAWRGWSLGRVVQRSQPPDWPGGARWPPRGNSALPAFLPLFLRPRNEDPSLAFARNLLPRYIYTPSCSLLSFFRVRSRIG